MRSLRRVLLWASAAGLLFSCSVNQSGLTEDGAVPAGAAGASGAAATGGRGGSTGGAGTAGSTVTGTAGNAGSGGTGHGGTTGTAGTTGAAGTGGTGNGAGAAGTTGSGGDANTAGTTGSGATGGTGGTGDAAGTTGSGAAGDAGTTGSAGTGGSAGTAGTGGSAGTIGGTGGSAGAGGRGGTGGRGGSGGRGGTTGTGGRGGTGGNPCFGYPSGAKAFVTPTDGRTHCYWTRSTSQTWSDAQQSCVQQNGHLITILSAEENAFAVNIAPFSGSFDDTWIGATDGKLGNDRGGAGNYKWVTNETWNYSNWEQGQPDGFCDPCSGGQTCTCDHRAVLASDGTWNDRWQDNMRSSICEATAN